MHTGTTQEAQDEMAAGFAERKSYVVGNRGPNNPTPAMAAVLASWKQQRKHWDLRSTSPSEKAEVLADMLGMEQLNGLSGSERFGTANDSWQAYDAYQHPTRKLGMFVVSTPHGGVRRLDILGSTKQEVEELRKHLVAWGLRPRRD
jgi:hypothetical protein